MHFKPKKRLGQNFLFDRNIQKKIIGACDFKPSDIVLEIGSGRGELTECIAGKVAFVYALEIDSILCNFLEARLESFTNIKIIHHDVLKLDFKKTFQAIKNKIKVIGNIPYYISSPILEYLLKFKNKISVIFIAVQKEFARRIIAVPGSKTYGAFSCFIQYYFEPKILFCIKKTSFSPQPKVDSCLIRFKIRPKAGVKVKDEELFFKIIRAAFGKRRKTLRNSLANIVLKKDLERFFNKFGIDRNIRPENLSLKDFANLSNI